MAIHSSANMANLYRSVEEYLDSTFTGATGIPTDVQAANWWWPGSKIETANLAYFVRADVSELARDFYSRVTSANQGYHVALLLTLEVYAQRQAYDADPHTLGAAVAMLRDGLRRGQAISLKNYDDGDGLTTAATLIVETLRTSPVREEGIWRKAMIEAVLHYVEQDVT